MEITILQQNGEQRRESVDSIMLAPGIGVHASAYSDRTTWTLSHEKSGGALAYITESRRVKTLRGAARVFSKLVAILPEGAGEMDGRDLARHLATDPAKMAVLREFRR